MNTHQNIFRGKKWDSPLTGGEEFNLILIFGEIQSLYTKELFDEIKNKYPNAEIAGCSTSGQTNGNDVLEECLCLTAISFESSRVKVCSMSINDNTYDTSSKIINNLIESDLKYVMSLSIGHNINGTELVDGLNRYLPEGVLVTGGLAGDGINFNSTFTCHNDYVGSDDIVMIGFYGESLTVSSGCEGGWDAFGADRLITKSEKNILYTLDGISALELYKKYLGEHSEDLPSSAILFPLVIKSNEGLITRTILDINEEDGSMIFAGDMPQGKYVQFMMANNENLINGSEIAAEKSLSLDHELNDSGLVIMISCIGRKLVLGNYVHEEVSAINEVFKNQWSLTGFYSYGEISPREYGQDCLLQNQTMTLTSLSEK